MGTTDAFEKKTSETDEVIELNNKQITQHFVRVSHLLISVG